MAPSEQNPDAGSGSRKKSRKNRGTAPGPAPVFTTLPPQPLFLIGMLGSLSYLAINALTRAVSFPLGAAWLQKASFLALAGLGVAGWAFLRRRGRAAPPEDFVRTLAPTSDPSRRIRVIGSARSLYAARPQNTAEFEPQVFLVPFALPDRRTPVIIAYSGLCAVLLGLVAWFERVGAMPRSGPWNYWAAMGVASLPLAMGWPTYLRVSPGRLDVLRYPFLGRGKPTFTSFNLRRARVCMTIGRGSGMVHLHRPPEDRVPANTPEPAPGQSAPVAPVQAARVVCQDSLSSSAAQASEPAPVGASELAARNFEIQIPIGLWMPRRPQLARAIAEAALSTTPTPPLPDDALTG